MQCRNIEPLFQDQILPLRVASNVKSLHLIFVISVFFMYSRNNDLNK